MNEGVIFDFYNPKWQYKGVLSAIADYETMDKETNCPMPMPKNYVAEVLAFIWVDENLDWNYKGRIKFPTGNKIAFGKNLGKQANETACLTAIYKFPMKEKHWFPNPSGDLNNLIELMKKEELIESIEVKNL